MPSRRDRSRWFGYTKSYYKIITCPLVVLKLVSWSPVIEPPSETHSKEKRVLVLGLEVESKIFIKALMREL